jgi:hypothetical protein
VKPDAAHLGMLCLHCLEHNIELQPARFSVAHKSLPEADAGSTGADRVAAVAVHITRGGGGK